MSTHQLLILSAPSGAGKTTLVKAMMANFPWLAFSVSATSRQPRGKEKDGVDYHFLSPEAFNQRV
ncbi:MAG: guanylate kinase, partial [Bacteroidetes bacterium]|nr:guanylate kinase [Bacteroidota bacterium]